MNGDFNLPFMGIWEEDKISEIFYHYTRKISEVKSLAPNKFQAKIISEFIHRNLMTQHMDSPTRYENILDLSFCSNNDMILRKDILSNVIFSDHTLNVIETEGLSEEQNKEVKNHCSTSIPDYITDKATDEENDNFINDLYQVEWDSMINLSDDVNQITDFIIDNIEV